MSDMVSVPAEKIAALREALDYWRDFPLPGRLMKAARAVVDAVETEDEPHCTCEHPKRQHGRQLDRCFGAGQTGDPGRCVCPCTEFTPAPSPASDDAEKPCPTCGHVCHEYCEHDAPSHMAAPDELTALRAENEDLKTRLDIAGIHQTARESDWTVDICNHIDLADALAERDALRERIRALADEWDGDWLAGETRDIVGELRGLLGDA